MGRVLFAKHEDVRAILGDKSLSKDFAAHASPTNPLRAAMLKQDADTAELAREEWPEYVGQRDASMIFMDDEEHLRVRKLFQEQLNSRTDQFASVTGRVVTDVIESLSSDRFDVVADFARLIPIRVIAILLDIPEEDFPKIQDWVDAAITASFSPLASAEEKAAAAQSRADLIMYGKGLLDQRKAEPQDDFLGTIASAQRDGYPISDSEIVENLALMFSAGFVTTADLISSTVYLLLSHPTQLAMLRERSQLLGNAIDDALRLLPPIMSAPRVSVEAREFQGFELPAGDYLIGSIAAANRDDAVFDSPDMFDISKRRARHLSWGGGAHTCLGASLARTEAKEAVSALLAAFPSLDIDPEFEGPEWRLSPFFRGLDRLPVVVS
ncbi:MAG: cytochrome P450 [Erythrobacter sp.]|nr:cytochrome P450 [Erythrobacter sp.]